MLCIQISRKELLRSVGGKYARVPSVAIIIGVLKRDFLPAFYLHCFYWPGPGPVPSPPPAYRSHQLLCNCPAKAKGILTIIISTQMMETASNSETLVST
jgi:hypothetical protein